MISYIITLLPRLLEGFRISIIVFGVTLALSIPLGLALSFASKSKFKFIGFIINTYTWLIRGTPLLLQLYVMFYGLPLILPISIRGNRLFFAVLTFVINYSAYFTEIFKGGLNIISNGQFESAKMLGMSRFSTYRYIIIPQIMRNTLHANANEAITLVKDTSLLAAVAVPELLMIAKESLSRDARVDALIASAVGYLLFTLVVVLIINRIGKKMRVEVKL